MAEFEKKYQEFLDGLSDDELMVYIASQWSEVRPIWKPCTKEEYDKHCPEIDLTTNEGIEQMIKNAANLFSYRKIPIWYNGGGILDQISGKEPDEYRYEKKVGTKKVIVVGGAMMSYIEKRGITDRFK